MRKIFGFIARLVPFGILSTAISIFRPIVMTATATAVSKSQDKLYAVYSAELTSLSVLSSLPGKAHVRTIIPLGSNEKSESVTGA